MSSLHEWAVESFARDVADVAGELARAGDLAAFIEALRELIEVASDWHVLVADVDDDRLVVRVAAGEFHLHVTR